MSCPRFVEGACIAIEDREAAILYYRLSSSCFSGSQEAIPNRTHLLAVDKIVLKSLSNNFVDDNRPHHPSRISFDIEGFVEKNQTSLFLIGEHDYVLFYCHRTSFRGATF
jgi:hypothetical protein